MPKVTGIGGVFFKSRDPAALAAWYSTHLGFSVEDWGGVQFDWVTPGYSLWAPFKESSGYFAPSDRPFMINFRVDDLDGLLASLRAGGAQVLDRRESTPQGEFGYVVDPEGTLLELWQPA